MIRDYYIPEEFSENSATQLDTICQQAYYHILNYNGLDVNDKTVVYSATVKFLEKAASYIGKNPEDEIRIANLLSISVANRNDEKGEKAGNIVPVVTVLPDFDAIVNGEIDLDERPKSVKFKEEEYPDGYGKILKTICNEAMVVMMNENNVDVSDENVIYISVCRFIETLADYLKHNKDYVIDISSLLKFRLKYIEDQNIYVPSVDIGERFKLSVKNDDSTEDE